MSTDSSGGTADVVRDILVRLRYELDQRSGESIRTAKGHMEELQATAAKATGQLRSAAHTAMEGVRSAAQASLDSVNAASKEITEQIVRQFQEVNPQLAAILAQIPDAYQKIAQQLSQDIGKSTKEASRDVDALVRKLAEAQGYSHVGPVPEMSWAYIAGSDRDRGAAAIQQDSESRVPLPRSASETGSMGEIGEEGARVLVKAFRDVNPEMAEMLAKIPEAYAQIANQLGEDIGKTTHEATLNVEKLVHRLAEAHGLTVSGTVPVLSAAYLARETGDHLGIGADQASRLPPRLQDLPAKEQGRVIRNRAALMLRMQRDEDRKVEEGLRIHESHVEEKADLASEAWSRIGAGSISLVKAGVEFGLSGNDKAQEILQGYMQLKGTLDAIGALDLVRGGGQLLGLPTARSVATGAASRAMHPLYRGALHLAGMTGLEVGGASVGAVGGSLLAALVGGGLGAYSIAEQFMAPKHRYLGNFIGKAEYGAMESVRGSTGFDTAGLLYGGRNPFGGDWAQNDKTARMEQALLDRRADEEAARQFAAPYVGDLRSMGLKMRYGQDEAKMLEAQRQILSRRDESLAERGEGEGDEERIATRQQMLQLDAQSLDLARRKNLEEQQASRRVLDSLQHQLALQKEMIAKAQEQRKAVTRDVAHLDPNQVIRLRRIKGKVERGEMLDQQDLDTPEGRMAIAGNKDVKAAAQRRWEQTNNDRDLGDVKEFLSHDAEVDEQIARQRKDSTETQIGDAQAKLDDLVVQNRKIVDAMDDVGKQILDAADMLADGATEIRGATQSILVALKELDDRVTAVAQDIKSGKDTTTTSRAITRNALGG